MSTRARRQLADRVVSLAATALAIILAAPSRALAQDQCDPSAGTIYAPGQGTSGLVLFEDLWNRNGDLDFNDQTIAYNYEFLLDSSGNVVTMKATINLLAVGATLHNGAYLHLPLARASTPVTVVDQDGNSITPLATETDLVIPLVNDTRSLFASQYPFINTKTALPVESATPLAFTIAFTNGATLDTSASPFDLFIARSTNFSYQIHLPQYPGTDAMNASLFGRGDDRSNQDLSASGGVDNSGRWFVNEHGLPFALTVPQIILWPQETVAIESVYTDLNGFASSGGTQDIDWYTDAPNINTGLAFTSGAGGQPPPTPQSVGSDLFCGCSIAFDYTGALQTYLVPSGVTSIVAKVWGAGGAACYATAGAGGYSQATLPVTPGEPLSILVGGTGGYPVQPGTLVSGSTGGLGGYGGGGPGGEGLPWIGLNDSPDYNDTGGCGGGGRSEITGSAGVITAGGGGGAGWGSVSGTPAAGGGAAGQTGSQVDACYGNGSGGGAASGGGNGVGGAGGTGCGDPSLTNDDGAGENAVAGFGNGGAGGSTTGGAGGSDTTGYRGRGGGGGGGGFGAGGGGGASDSWSAGVGGGGGGRTLPGGTTIAGNGATPPNSTDPDIGNAATPDNNGRIVLLVPISGACL